MVAVGNTACVVVVSSREYCRCGGGSSREYCMCGGG